MAKAIVSTDQAPAAIGPYSQAVRSNGFLFLSGQLPLDPADGSIVQGGIAEQTRRVFANVGAVLAGAGLSFADVVKVTVFLKDLSQYGIVNQIYSEYFPSDPPARSAVEVSRLPKDALIELEVIAAEG